VEQDVSMRRGGLDADAVDTDVVASGVGFDAHLANGRAVDRDASFGNQLLGGAAGGDTGLGEDFLESFHAIRQVHAIAIRCAWTRPTGCGGPGVPLLSQHIRPEADELPRFRGGR
jgi:hypothetical protein